MTPDMVSCTEKFYPEGVNNLRRSGLSLRDSWGMIFVTPLDRRVGKYPYPGPIIRQAPLRAAHPPRPFLSTQGHSIPIFYHRACGEHVRTERICCNGSGSSPRMRGTLLGKGIAPSSKRFIPAHAGNTARAASMVFPLPVHPRACGEHWR